MNHTETAALIRYVAALCPAQKLADDFIADAWHDAIGDLPFGLAKLAAARCSRTKTFISPSDIIAAAKAMRKAVDPHVTDTLNEVEGWAPDDPDADYPAWARARRARVGWLVDYAIAHGAVAFGPDEIYPGNTVVDIAKLPLEPKPQLPTVDHKADIVQITRHARRMA